jgi:hypothetical protein
MPHHGTPAKNWQRSVPGCIMGKCDERESCHPSTTDLVAAGGSCRAKWQVTTCRKSARPLTDSGVMCFFSTSTQEDNMYARRSAGLILIVPTIALLLVGCATGSELPQGPNAVWHLVVIGDSSLGGLGKAFASQIEQDTEVQVILKDFALPSLSAGQVLQALQTGHSPRFLLESLAAALRDAEVVVMFVNPVDSVDPEKPLDLDGCFVSSPPGPCNPEAFEKWTSDLKAIWAEILMLRSGQPTILRATDLYNPLISPWNEHGVYEACTECWENMSNAARLAAEAYGIPFLSRLDAFNGPNHDEDPRQKGYIVSDGEHPSHLAAQFTAELLSQMGYEPVAEP